MNAQPTSRGTAPNLLLIMADQHAAHAMSCAGAAHLNTPALDELAATGTRFTRAYATFPLCVPSRASMLTGLYPHRLATVRPQTRRHAGPGRWGTCCEPADTTRPMPASGTPLLPRLTPTTVSR